MFGSKIFEGFNVKLQLNIIKVCIDIINGKKDFNYTK